VALSARDEIRVQVVGVFERQIVFYNQEQRIPLLLVRDASDRELHLPIGSCEGLAIHLALNQQVVPRPLTHDLGLRILERLSAQLGRVVIDDLSEEGSHATIHLRTAESDLTVDARPGDAVALALRAEAPIYVTEELLARAAESGRDAF